MFCSPLSKETFFFFSIRTEALLGLFFFLTLLCVCVHFFTFHFFCHCEKKPNERRRPQLKKNVVMNIGNTSADVFRCVVKKAFKNDVFFFIIVFLFSCKHKTFFGVGHHIFIKGGPVYEVMKRSLDWAICLNMRHIANSPLSVDGHSRRGGVICLDVSHISNCLLVVDIH